MITIRVNTAKMDVAIMTEYFYRKLENVNRTDKRLRRMKMDEYISKDKLMQYLEPKTNTPAIIIKRHIEDMPSANVLPIERGKYSDTIRRIELFISYYWSLDRDEEEEKDYVALKEALDVLKRINGEGENIQNSQESNLLETEVDGLFLHFEQED